MPCVATWMDLENITLSKVSQKDKYHMIRYDITHKTNITYMWNFFRNSKKIQMNLFTKQKLTHRLTQKMNLR